MRIFFAFEISDEIKSKISSELQLHSIDNIRFISEDNFHVTFAFLGEIKKKEEIAAPTQVVYAGAPLITATEIKVNVSMPEVAERAAATGADGVGLLRAEHMILGTGVHPIKVLEEKGEDALVDVFADGIRKVADAF